MPSRYQVIKRLCEGSFGFVVAAKDKQTNKLVAIKKIKDAVNDEQDGIRYESLMDQICFVAGLTAIHFLAYVVGCFVN